MEKRRIEKMKEEFTKFLEIHFFYNNILLAKLFKKLELSDSYESVEYRMNKEKTLFTGNAIFGFKNSENARIA